MSRAQSNVVGVALLMGVVVISLASLTATIGAIVEQNAATADATRVASDFDRALAPVEATGVHRGRVSFSDGRLRTVERELRVLNESGVRRRIEVDGLVFTAGERRVAFLAGAVVRGRGENAQLYAPPPITASRTSGDGGVLVVGAPRLGASSVSVEANGGTTTVLRSNVSHDRRPLGNGTYRVAVETATPTVWESYFRERNASVGRSDFDGDGVTSVVAEFPGERVGYLVVHDLRVEVGYGR